MTTRVLVLGAWTGEDIPMWADKAAENHLQYAKRHGYGHLFMRIRQSDYGVEGGARISPTWAKVFALREALLDGRWSHIFLIDMDSFFADLNRSLEDLMAMREPIVATGDLNDLCNTGHILLRNNQKTHELVNSWWSLRGYVWPKLPTAHQNHETGLVNDQVAFNYLLAGGIMSPEDVWRTGKYFFNRTNGYRKNKNRQFKSFDRIFAPTNRVRARLARFLIATQLRKHVRLVPQPRLNWYPVNEVPTPHKHPIVHYPGGLKKRLLPDLESLQLNDATQ